MSDTYNNQLYGGGLPDPELEQDGLVNRLVRYGSGSSVIDQLLGLGGRERYQLWPEKMIRSAVTLPGDVASGRVRMNDPDTNMPTPEVIERVQDLANLAIGGTLPAVAARGAARNTLGSAPVPREYKAVRAAEQSDPNYVYHATSAERAEEIASSGLRLHKPQEFTDQTVWPDGKSEPRNYFTPTAANTWQFAPEDGTPVLLRAKKDSHEFKTESTGDVYSTKELPASKLEYLAPDGQWHSLVELKSKEPAPVFYSAVEGALEHSTMGSAPADQWLATLRNAKGVKPEELDWLGVQEFLAEKKAAGQKVTRAELQDHIRDNKVEIKEVYKKQGEGDEAIYSERDQDRADEWAISVLYDDWRSQNEHKFKSDEELLDAWGKYTETDAYLDRLGELSLNRLYDYYEPVSVGGPDATKHHEYQLPGGTDYGELLLTLPERNKVVDDATALDKAKRYYESFPSNGPGSFDRMTPGEQRTYIDAAKEQKMKFEDNYWSSHWDEPNVLAHVRYNTREIPRPFTTEETAALAAREAAKPELERVRREQDKVALQIQDTVKPLEDARRAKIRDDIKARRISGPEGLRALEGYYAHPEIKPLQDKLQALRAEEDAINAKLPPEPKQTAQKTLFIEEVQSDWHQQGKKKGYASERKALLDATVAAEKKAIATQQLYGEHDPRAIAARDAYVGADDRLAAFDRKSGSAVPDAPFKKTWPELAMKRMIRYAAENGYDAIAWTPGEVQAARYDLSKQIKELRYTKNADGTYELGANQNPETWTEQNIGSKIPEAKLADYVGKDVAERIAKGVGQDAKEGGGKILSGLDLKVGGEGMLRFYDDQLPVIAGKLAKSHGGKVEQRKLNSGLVLTPVETQVNPATRSIIYHVDHPNNPDIPGQAFMSRENAEAHIRSQSPAVHFMELPQGLRDTALQKGFPLFSSGFMLTPVDGNPFEQKDDKK